MSVADFLNRSIAQTAKSMLQQQYRYLEERMKLFELNMNSTLKMIEQVATAIDRNSILLDKFLSSASEHSLQSQQVIDRLSLQLNEIQTSLQKIPLIRIDTETIGKSDQFKDSKNGSKFIDEIQQANDNPADDEEKKSRSPSSARDLEKKELLDQQSWSGGLLMSEDLTVMAKQFHDLEISTFNQDVKQVPASSIGNPLTEVHSDNEILSDSEFDVPRAKEPIHEVPIESPNTVNDKKDLLEVFKNVELFEWREPDKSILPRGQGDLKFKKEDGKLSVKFMLDKKLLNYWMNVDFRFKKIRKNAVMFDCRGGSEDAPTKILLSVLPGPSNAEELFDFLDENFTVSKF